MKLELKSIKHNPSLSEETEAFTADLWVNGKKVAYCSNRGHGGCTDYRAYDKLLQPLLAEAEVYCKSLPPVTYLKSTLDMDLGFKIDNMLFEWLEAKEYSKSLIYEKPNGDVIQTTWKGITLAKMLKTQLGIQTIQKKVTQLKSEGCKIRNTNLGGIK